MKKVVGTLLISVLASSAVFAQGGRDRSGINQYEGKVDMEALRAKTDQKAQEVCEKLDLHTAKNINGETALYIVETNNGVEAGPIESASILVQCSKRQAIDATVIALDLSTKGGAAVINGTASAIKGLYKGTSRALAFGEDVVWFVVDDVIVDSLKGIGRFMKKHSVPADQVLRSGQGR